MSSRRLYKAKKKVGPFKRGMKWIKAHWRTITLTGEGLLLLYSLYLANKHGKKALERTKRLLEEAEKRFGDTKAKIMAQDKILEDIGFYKYLEEEGITGLERIK